MDSDRSAPLPLRDAMLRWCDQSLVQSAIAADAEFKAAPPEPRGPSWFRGDSLEEVRAWRAAPSPRRNLKQRAELAWQALIDNFRTLVATEAVVLSGLQTKPSLAFVRSDVPPAWASQMRFSVDSSRVRIADLQFVDVMARQRTNAQAAQQSESPRAGPGASDTLYLEDELPSKPRAKPGRKSTADLIKQALLGRWAEVTAEAGRAATNRPNFARLAKSLRKQLMRQRPALDEKRIPQEDTIRRNLPSIYDELLGETRCGK